MLDQVLSVLGDPQVQTALSHVVIAIMQIVVAVLVAKRRGR